ncbi:MAG TPA: class II fructose-bisphosphate aldolase, partial [Candidatus Eisenbacteria bacterium]
GLAAGFFNIDIDTSTLVDLSFPTLDQQQRENYQRAAELTAYVRDQQPEKVTVSVGGEIGEVGGKNSTVEELQAYMDGYNRSLKKLGKHYVGLSKISVQTGTSHGGVPLPDGSIARVKVDFDALEALSRLAREQYGLAGAVQHGATTLPAELFDKFPMLGACEIHLATDFQSMIFDHPSFPPELKGEIYERLRVVAADERKAGDTDEQFFYKTRKKAIGLYKRELWGMPATAREAIGRALEERFRLLLHRLRAGRTRAVAERYAPFVPGSFPATGAPAAAGRTPEDVTGLSD